MSQLLTAHGRAFDQINLIYNSDPNAGFCALIIYALNGVRRSLGSNRLPIVNFDKDNCPYFYDKAYGENIWEYFFEPVFEMSYQELEDRLASKELDPSMIHLDNPEDLSHWHHFDPERIATFWAYEIPDDPNEWMAIKRELGRQYVADYIRIKPHIRNKVNTFFDQNMGGTYTFGVHIRGTDFAYAEPTPPEAYFKAIHGVSQQHGLKNFKVFLATDQTQFVNMFRQEFGEMLVNYDSIRSTGNEPAFRFSDVSGYKKGEDVLIDLLLLSRCDHVLKGAAAVGEIALWFNRDLECTDFALKSRFDRRGCDFLVSAYEKLSIAESRPWRQKAVKIYYQHLDRHLGPGGPTEPIRRIWRYCRRLVRHDAE